jgi:4'-phosphopantetheinyl transferase
MDEDGRAGGEAIAWPRRDASEGDAGELAASGMVHVWGWKLGGWKSQRARLDLAAEIGLLDEVERRRMERLVSPEAAARFAVSHARVRQILGGYLGVPGGSLRFAAGAMGKPELQAGAEKLQFNLSHTRTIGLLAVAREPVGVDVEEVRPIERAVAETQFSERERGDLAELEGEAWLRGFYRCWTSKEAILKAEGWGVGNRLADFDVSVQPEATPALLETRIVGMRKWRLHDVCASETTIGALAVAGDEVAVQCFRYSAE